MQTSRRWGGAWRTRAQGVGGSAQLANIVSFVWMVLGALCALDTPKLKNFRFKVNLNLRNVVKKSKPENDTKNIHVVNHVHK